MSIAKKALTAVGYVKAPRTTFLLKHPIKGLGAWAAYRAARKAAPRRRTVATATAAALAVPLAWRFLRAPSKDAK